MRAEIERRRDEELGAACDEGEGLRYDPMAYYSEILADEWLTDSKQNAAGVQHPAVLNGQILFTQPVPGEGHSNFSGESNGAKPPLPFTAVSMGLEVLNPPTLNIREDTLAAGGNVRYADSHGQILSALIARGFFTLLYGEVKILDRVPVSTVGARGGLWVAGGGPAGYAQVQDPSRRNGFPLPDELVLEPGSGAVLKAWIDLNPSDLAVLGTVANPGYGAAVMPGCIFQPGMAPVDVDVVAMPPIYRGVRWVLFGRRGLNVQAGTGSLRSAARRQGRA